MTVAMPHNFTPRRYQAQLYNALADGYRRGIAIWHRRSGKDKTLINVAAKETHKRIGAYDYLYPTYAQGKKAIWDGMDKAGFKYMDHFPEQLVARKNDTELKVVLKNRSLFQIIGSDNYDSVMSTNPLGCVFSEFSLQDPSAWAYMMPILHENGGWAMFAYTPRGRNHAYKLYKDAMRDPATWFCQVLTVENTGMEYLVDEARKDNMSDEMIDQEFYCSFNAPQMGAYYGKEMTAARKDKRIGNVPHDPSLLVHTFWDLGIHDYMCIWFTQFAGQEIHDIDYFEDHDQGMSYYVKTLEERRRELRYTYGEHWAPHDIEVRELSTGLTRRESASQMGINFNVVPLSNLMDGIEAVRRILHRCWFDETRADRGVTCLENYRKQWNEKHQVYSNAPLHDEFSHGADAKRTQAVAIGMGAGNPNSGMTSSDVKAKLRARGFRV